MTGEGGKVNMSVSLWLLTESDSELVPLPTLKPSVSHLFKISLNVISWIWCKHWCYLTKKVNDSSCPTVSFVQRAAATGTCCCLSLLMLYFPFGHVSLHRIIYIRIQEHNNSLICIVSVSMSDKNQSDDPPATPTSLVSCFDRFSGVQNFNLLFPFKFVKRSERYSFQSSTSVFNICTVMTKMNTQLI